jgi:hypothetical protein
VPREHHGDHSALQDGIGKIARLSVPILVGRNLQNIAWLNFLRVDDINPMAGKVLQPLLVVPFKQHICILSVSYASDMGHRKESLLKAHGPFAFIHMSSAS